MKYHLTPRASRNNDFTAHLDGRPSCMWSETEERKAQKLELVASKLSVKQRSHKATRFVPQNQQMQSVSVRPGNISIDPHPQASQDKRESIRRASI